MVRIFSILEEINFSMIISFDRYPEVNGNPISAIFVILNVEIIVGMLFGLFLIIRMSW